MALELMALELIDLEVDKDSDTEREAVDTTVLDGVADEVGGGVHTEEDVEGGGGGGGLDGGGGAGFVPLDHVPSYVTS